MFVKYKTPLWYLNAMEGILDKMYVGSDEFDDDLKKIYCLADEINYTSNKIKKATEHRNKIKRQYGERLDRLFNKRSCSSNFNLFEFCSTTTEYFFSELFEAKKLMKELQELILSSRQTIKNDLGGMHDIWKKWYNKLFCTEKEKGKPAPAPKKKYQLNLTRAESVQLLRQLTYALKKDPTKDNFVMTLDEL